MIRSVGDCNVDHLDPEQPDRCEAAPEADPRPPSKATVRPDWTAYNRQEDSEPFDTIKEMMGTVPRRDLDTKHRMELDIQAFVRQIKENSKNYKSNKDAFFNSTKCYLPTEAIAHCKSRLGLGRGISLLLQWHYCLFLYFAERKDWLVQALPLMLESAASTVDDSRASSYIMTAHNLDKWYNCGKNKAVLNSALHFVEERNHNNFTHWCVHIIADLGETPATRNKTRDTMIRAAGDLDHPHAGHCLEAAVSVAADKKPAREACMHLYEGHADRSGNPSLAMHGLFDALRHAGGAKDRRRLAGKIMRAAESIIFTEYVHAYRMPAYDPPGRTGPERVRHLVSLLGSLISPAGGAAQPYEDEAHERRGLFDRVTIGSDMVPRPPASARRGGEEEAAVRGGALARYIQILAAFLSASALAYEKDGRIAACDHMHVIRSSGLCSGPTEALIKAGIERHYAGDHISSVHTLLPQVEQVLRIALAENGITVVGAAGAPKFGLMKTMIKRGAGVLGPDLSAFLSALLIDMDSVNLRNRVCHGLHNASACPAGLNLPHDFRHATSLLLVLIIELVCSRLGSAPDLGGEEER